MKDYDCLYRLLEHCNCAYDVDPRHYPNNYDCPKYYPASKIWGEIIIPEPELANNHIEVLRQQQRELRCRELSDLIR